MGTEEHAIPWNKLTYDTHLGGYRTDITEALQPFRAIEITTMVVFFLALWLIANTALTKIDFGEPTLADSHEHKPKCTWPITLTKEYTQWANQQALTQLGKAGFRLAALLRAIFREPLISRWPPSDEVIVTC